MTIRCLCVDDEPLARQGLALALQAHEDFELVASYGSADQVLAQPTPQADVVFLDIEMPRRNGFQLLEDWPLFQTGSNPPLVVFVTAYNQYAVQAFEAQALDYILKPIREDRFAAVAQRIREQIGGARRTQTQLLQTIETLKQKLAEDQVAISVKTDEGYFRVKLSEILYIESIGDFVCLHLADRQFITRASLKQYLADLNQHGFHQIHKSHLVNIAHIIGVVRLRFGDHQVQLTGGKTLRMSRRYKDVLSLI